MSNENLNKARKAKNDEFYTQYQDIQTEINAYLDYNSNLFKDKIVLCPCDDPGWSNFTKYFIDHFEEFGLLKLISTCYIEGGHGKLLVKDRNKTIKQELQGDGDFRSQEVTTIRDQADFIITNPPFSLFREFMDWIWKGPGLHYLLISNKNAITYKEIFPKIKNNLMWSGAKPWSNFEFEIPEIDGKGDKVKKSVPAIWLTNIDHGRKHQPLQLMSIADNLKHSKHKSIKGKTFEEAYPKYDNYDAIEVSYTDAIPKDYEGVMGVPISFLDKYCPDQFEILGLTSGRNEFDKLAWPIKKYINAIQHNSDGSITGGSKANTRACLVVNNPGGIYYTADNTSEKLEITYARILIRKK